MKNIKLTKQLSRDIKRFGLNEDFILSDLKSKYLSLTKVYHPDIRQNDPQATRLFQELKESYERLKVFNELKLNYKSFEDSISKHGRVVVDEVVTNFHEFYRTDRKEIIKVLCK
jgi:DnaJ-class molecular chaperone